MVRAALPGIAAGPLFPLYWLRGTVRAERCDVTATGATRHRGVLDPAQAVARARPQDRAGVRASLRQTGIDRPGPGLGFDAVVDADGLVRRIALVLPVPDPPPRPFEDELAVRLELDDVGTPVWLERPADADHVTVEEFVRALIGDPGAEDFRHLWT